MNKKVEEEGNEDSRPVVTRPEKQQKTMANNHHDGNSNRGTIDPSSSSSSCAPFVYTGDNGDEIPTDVEQIIISDGVITIPKMAFAGHDEQLQSVVISSSVKVIDEGAFKCCLNLTKIQFSQGGCLKSISKNAFYNCKELEEVVLPDGLEEIGDNAFEHCTNLKSIIFPSSVKKIGSVAFCDCSRLGTIESPDELQDMNNLQEGLKEIGHYAFRGCRNLKSIKIPSSVKKIGSGAFSDCSRLEAINLPDGLRFMGNFLFSGCKALKFFHFPSSAKCIPQGAFANSGLETITIPSSVKEVRHLSFAGCDQLEKIEFLGRPEVFGGGVFDVDGCPQGMSLCFPPRMEAPVTETYGSRFSYRSICYMKGRNAGLEPTKFFQGDAVENNNGPVATPPPTKMFDDFDFYESLCANKNGQLIDIRSIQLVSRLVMVPDGREMVLCGIHVHYGSSDSKETHCPNHRYQKQEGDDDSWMIHLKQGEYVMGLIPYVSRGNHVSSPGGIRPEVFGLTFVTNKRQVHWGNRDGYIHPYSLMFDDGSNSTASSRSRIVALASTSALSPHESIGCVAGIGCYARRFNWFSIVGEFIRVRWLLGKNRAIIVENDDDQDDISTNDVIVGVLNFQDELFRKVLTFL